MTTKRGGHRGRPGVEAHPPSARTGRRDGVGGGVFPVVVRQHAAFQRRGNRSAVPLWQAMPEAPDAPAVTLAGGAVATFAE